MEKKRKGRSINRDTREMYDKLVDSGKAIYHPDLINPITVDKDIVTIHCYRKGELHKTRINKDDMDKVALGYSISLVSKGGLYPRVNGDVRRYIHQLIIDCPDDLVIHHINNDTLDNRKENLETITQEENLLHKKMFKTNTTGVRNLTYKDGCYSLNINRTFVSKETAEAALNKAEKAIQPYSIIDAKERAEIRLNRAEQ
ncbi:MAG TPA: HNH endonuclease [Epulopiscium sp.]|nr:HNH endonuclease [Candidatus Epulonipiscium sp.]